MNERRSEKMTEADLRRELEAMSDPVDAPAELWRAALAQVRAEPLRTRRFPGRRRVWRTSAVALATLAIGVILTTVLIESTSTVGIGRAPGASATEGDLRALGDQLDAMLGVEQGTESRLAGADIVVGAAAASAPWEAMLRSQVSRERLERTAGRSLAATASDELSDDSSSAGLADAAALTYAPAAERAPTEAMVPLAAGQPPARPAPALERSADIELRVAAVDEAIVRAESLVNPNAGEFVRLARIEGEGDRRRGAVTLRVSSDRFAAVLDAVRELGRSARFEATTTDLSALIERQEAELGLLLQTERELLDRLPRAEANAPVQVYRYGQDLTGTRQGIADAENTLRLLRDRVAFATIRVLVTVEPTPQQAEPGFLRLAGTALEDGMREARHVLLWLVRRVVGSAPVIALLALVSWLGWHLWRQRSVGGIG